MLLLWVCVWVHDLFLCTPVFAVLPNVVTPGCLIPVIFHKQTPLHISPEVLIKSSASTKFISQQSRCKISIFVFKALFTPNSPSNPAQLGCNPKALLAKWVLGGQICRSVCVWVSEADSLYNYVLVCLCVSYSMCSHMFECVFKLILTDCCAVVWLTSPLKMLVGRWLLNYLFLFYRVRKANKCLSQPPMRSPADRCNTVLDFCLLTAITKHTMS